MEYALGIREIKGEVSIGRAADALPLLEPYRDLPREMMIVIHLDSNLDAKAIQVAAVGNRDSCCFDTRDIFRAAINRDSTAAMILAHNHPYEKVAMPSAQDVASTKRLYEVGEAARMPILDHILLAPRNHMSFKFSGLVFPAGACYVYNTRSHVVMKPRRIRRRRP